LSLHLPKSGIRSTTENGQLQTISDGLISTYPSLLLQATTEKLETTTIVTMIQTLQLA
jgi:hypothetical protein